MGGLVAGRHPVCHLWCPAWLWKDRETAGVAVASQVGNGGTHALLHILGAPVSCQVASASFGPCGG